MLTALQALISVPFWTGVSPAWVADANQQLPLPPCTQTLGMEAGKQVSRPESQVLGLRRARHGST